MENKTKYQSIEDAVKELKGKKVVVIKSGHDEYSEVTKPFYEEIGATILDERINEFSNLVSDKERSKYISVDINMEKLFTENNRVGPVVESLERHPMLFVDFPYREIYSHIDSAITKTGNIIQARRFLSACMDYGAAIIDRGCDDCRETPYRALFGVLREIKNKQGLFPNLWFVNVPESEQEDLPSGSKMISLEDIQKVYKN